jgi:hypothetical protein
MEDSPRSLRIGERFNGDGWAVVVEVEGVRLEVHLEGTAAACQPFRPLTECIPQWADHERAARGLTLPELAAEGPLKLTHHDLRTLGALAP